MGLPSVCAAIPATHHADTLTTHPPQVMEVKEQAERKIARLNTRVQQLESKVGRRAFRGSAPLHRCRPLPMPAGTHMRQRSSPNTAIPPPPPSQVNRLGDENAALQERLAEAQGAVAQAAAAVDAAGAEGASGAAELAAARQDRAGLESRCAQLEGELRKSKRREEKLQARARAGVA